MALARFSLHLRGSTPTSSLAALCAARYSSVALGGVAGGGGTTCAEMWHMARANNNASKSSLDILLLSNEVCGST